jgi:hypothetical protein
MAAIWYVFYGVGRMMSVPGKAASGGGWTLRTFDSEKAALDLACTLVKGNYTVEVGTLSGEETFRKHDTASLKAICGD